MNSLQNRYKIEENNIEKAYSYQLSLKNNEEYEKRVDNTFLEIATLFIKRYPNVKIAPPQGREKSNKSLRNKIENLEIERLCKLYAIEGLTQEEKVELFSMILKRTRGKLKNEIKTIAIGEIKDLKQIDKIVIKTALLRMARTKIEKGNAQNKEELLKELERKYGETAAKETNQLKNNLLHWETIEKCKEDATSLKELHQPFTYLKVKDLRGFEIIIADVPNNMETENEELKQLLKEREQVSKEKKAEYDDLCCTILANEFTMELINNEELLEKLNIQVLPNGYKHKEKQNGYLAEHIKFCYRDHPEYTFEVQFRSIYREDLTRANGKAAHDKRSGKKRVFPSVTNKSIFIEELKREVPIYRILKKKEDGFKIHKCTMAENMVEYYLGFVEVDSKEYRKAIQYIQEEQENQK